MLERGRLLEDLRPYTHQVAVVGEAMFFQVLQSPMWMQVPNWNRTFLNSLPPNPPQVSPFRPRTVYIVRIVPGVRLGCVGFGWETRLGLAARLEWSGASWDVYCHRKPSIHLRSVCEGKRRGTRSASRVGQFSLDDTDNDLVISHENKKEAVRVSSCCGLITPGCLWQLRWDGLQSVRISIRWPVV